MIAVVDLTSEMLTYYGDEEGIPEYINMLEESQKGHSGRNSPYPT